MNIALLVMYMWAHPMTKCFATSYPVQVVDCPDYSYRPTLGSGTPGSTSYSFNIQSFDQGTAILMQPKNGLAPVGNLCPAGASCYPTVMVTEPQDVPAVQKLVKIYNPVLLGTIVTPPPPPFHYEQRWACADKSRILLTAEDGSKWCHKVSR